MIFKRLYESVLGALECDTFECAQKSSTENLSLAAQMTRYNVRHPTKISGEYGFMPIIDQKMIKNQIFDLISRGQLRPNTGISISYSENDSSKITKSDFLEILYKYLPGEIPSVQNAWSLTEIKIPKIIHQKFINKYFGLKSEAISEIFACDEPDCFKQFSKLIFSLTKICTSRKALENSEISSNKLNSILKTEFSKKANDENSFLEIEEGTKCDCNQEDLIYGIKGKGHIKCIST